MEVFLQALSAWNITLTKEQQEQFRQYLHLIQEWNEKIDITAICEEKEIYTRHFLDSLSVVRVLPKEVKGSWVDIGTGGGFPGVPLAILFPQCSFLLVDSLNKRILFLKEVCETLHLSNVKPVHARAEEIFRDAAYREKYDWAVSRAVASLPTLLEYCLPAVRLGGHFIAMKGPSGTEEAQNAKKALTVLGGEIANIDAFTISEEEMQRQLIVVQKIKKTPPSYPRGQGKPRKKPL